MSHEIRTPMNAIIGMAAIGLSAENVERKQYCLTKIAGASRHLLGVINDILDMSKIEADKFELSISEFSLSAMLERVADVIRFQVGPKRQRFAVFIDDAFPASVIGDEQRMAQVITNLLSNAVKFTPEEGEIALRAELAGEDEMRCALRIVVTDTGIGFSAEQQGRLFRPFEQADGSISRKFGGTGLGLAISKRIAEAMGGTIEVGSAPGKGSTFTFSVSIAKGRERAEIKKMFPPFRKPSVPWVNSGGNACSWPRTWKSTVKLSRPCWSQHRSTWSSPGTGPRPWTWFWPPPKAMT